VFSIVQAFATLGIGIIIGVIYIWKVGLVGLGISPQLIKFECTLNRLLDIACVPFLISTGYIRLVNYPMSAVYT
jgi:ATP-binding cassette subfamily B (MDR/TAP) protein 1